MYDEYILCMNNFPFCSVQLKTDKWIIFYGYVRHVYTILIELSIKQKVVTINYDVDLI